MVAPCSNAALIYCAERSQDNLELRTARGAAHNRRDLCPIHFISESLVPDSPVGETLPRTFAVLQQFPFSPQRPGISYFAVHSVSWNEATVLERRFPSGIDPGQATLIAAELVHDDYAYVFEAHWDLWTPDLSNANWILEPATVKFIVQGEEFDEGSYKQNGHIQVDLGLDSYFLQPETSLTDQTRAKIRDNVAKLVEFSVKVEKNSGTNARLLWSESEESLAQKLVARLQRVQ